MTNQGEGELIAHLRRDGVSNYLMFAFALRARIAWARSVAGAAEARTAWRTLASQLVSAHAIATYPARTAPGLVSDIPDLVWVWRKAFRAEANQAIDSRSIDGLRTQLFDLVLQTADAAECLWDNAHMTRVNQAVTMWVGEVEHEYRQAALTIAADFGYTAPRDGSLPSPQLARAQRAANAISRAYAQFRVVGITLDSNLS